MKDTYFREMYEDIQQNIKEALVRDYDLFREPEISLLKFSENIICMVRQGENRKAVLRINRPNYHDSKELESELRWITQIRRYTDINTPIVYEGKNGEMLQHFISSNGYAYTYSVQSFITGKTIKELQGDGVHDELEKVGEIAAKLHCLEENRPHSMEKFKRFTWDIEDTLSENARWGHFLLFDGLDEEDKKLFCLAAEKIKKKLTAYGRNVHNYGLIHADLHSENLLVDKDIISLIDFDDCGYGWYLYDLASAVSQQSYGLDEMTEAYLKGYQKIRKLREADLKEIDTFILLRRLVRMGWMTTRKDNGVLERDGEEYYKATKEFAKIFIKD